MKRMNLLIIGLITGTFLYAQQGLTVPQLTQDQKQEVLFQHVMAYATTGISFGKTQGVSPEEYGRFIGKSFTGAWDPSAGYQMFAGQLMYILAGMYPDNQMEILEQDDKMIRFRMKNVDIFFRNGPVFGVTFEELLQCSKGIISELGDYMGVEFSHKWVDNTWYEVTFKAR